MSSPVLQAWKRLGVVAMSTVLLSPAIAENGFAPQGAEYPIAGLLLGDQVFPHVAVSGSGGYVVWHDNATDGDGFGVSARRLKEDLLGSLSTFRVNQQGAGDQQNAQVAMLQNGGAVFVWQGGRQNEQDIFARFIGSDGTFTTGDLQVNTYSAGQQISPAVTVVAGGNVLVVWSSFAQDGSYLGVYGQWLSASGESAGGEFQINQHIMANQRTPAVAALNNGKAVVAWVSEQQRGELTVDVYARVLSGSREVPQKEFLVNTTTNVCANPSVASAPGGGFVAAWGEHPTVEGQRPGWNVYARAFNSSGEPTSDPVQINTHANGSHFAPRLAAIGEDVFVAWISMDQDGSDEGIFGRFLTSGLLAATAEFQVNSSTPGRQTYPAVASDGVGRFLAVWSSWVGGRTSTDLLAQRYAPGPVKPAAPFVTAISSSKLSVTWPDAEIQAVSAYELYTDADSEPVVVTGNIWNAGGFAPASTHAFRLAYRYASGGSSLLSSPASGTTWGADENLDGLPDDWQSRNWGSDSAKWADPKDDSDGDGATNLQEFLAGTIPTDAASVLRTSLTSTEQGAFLSWNTQPGCVYQVQSKPELALNWTDVGAPRFAAGSTDSMLIEATETAVYYRVKRLR